MAELTSLTKQQLGNVFRAAADFAGGPEGRKIVPPEVTDEMLAEVNAAPNVVVAAANLAEKLFKADQP